MLNVAFPEDAALGLPANLVHVFNPSAREGLLRILAVVEADKERFVFDAKRDYVRSFGRVVIVKNDVEMRIARGKYLLNQPSLNGICELVESFGFLGDVSTGPIPD